MRPEGREPRKHTNHTQELRLLAWITEWGVFWSYLYGSDRDGFVRRCPAGRKRYSGLPSPVGDTSTTPNGCLNLQIVPNPKYTITLPRRT